MTNPITETCGRGACNFPLNLGFWRIWNVPSVVDGHRDYCADCGRKIIEHNKATTKPNSPQRLKEQRYNRQGEAL